MPPAPARFSTSTRCGSAALKRSASTRAMMSLLLDPAGYGTIKRTGFAGKS
jgi:hypothetical protein